MIAMVGAVALVMSSHKASPSAMLQTVARSDNELANNLLKAGPSASVAQLHQHIQSYANSQMLASAPTTMLGDGGAGKLCPKADVVIAKLDTLYNKLQNGATEETDDRKAAKKKMEDDHAAYLECESSYDLASKEKGEAKKGADYATDQFNNYKDTVQQAERNIVTLRSETGKKLESLKAEYDMIMKILSMLGMIEEVGPSAKGLEAGGRVVEPAKGLAPVAAPVGAAAQADVNKQIANLKQAAAQMGGVQMQQAAKLTNLMAYQETDEVKAILMKMLEDIQSQIDTANAMLADAEGDLAGQKATLAGYEQTMVDLNNKHNKAAGALIASDQHRAGCFADKKISEETYIDLLARDTMLQPSTLKEMAIIIRIELKLQDFCGSYFAQNGISTGNANAYFKDNGIDLQNPQDGRFCVTAFFLGQDINYNVFPNVNNKFPDYAFLADDLDFTGINEPRKALLNGFSETLRIGDKKDDANLLAAGATQSLLQVEPARTQSLLFGNIFNAIKNKVAEIVQNVQAKVAEVKVNVQNKIDDIKDKIDNVVAKPRVNMAVKGKNSKDSINVGSDSFYMEMNGVIEVSETTNYKFCIKSDDLGAVFIDGKQVGATASYGNDQCGTVALDAGYRYVQVKYTDGTGENNLSIKAAKCKKENAGDCENLKQIRPKMSWPPVCADAVKYDTNIGLFKV